MRIWSIWMLMVMMIPLVTSCGDDGEEVNTINKSELIGSWYTLEDDWVFAFTESTVTLYEIWHNSGKYLLNPAYSVTKKYTISGNRIVTEDNHVAIINLVNNNTISIVIDNEKMTLKKFNGTPQQLMDYLNME